MSSIYHKSYCISCRTVPRAGPRDGQEKRTRPTLKIKWNWVYGFCVWGGVPSAGLCVRLEAVALEWSHRRECAACALKCPQVSATSRQLGRSSCPWRFLPLVGQPMRSSASLCTTSLPRQRVLSSICRVTGGVEQRRINALGPQLQRTITFSKIRKGFPRLQTGTVHIFNCTRDEKEWISPFVRKKVATAAFISRHPQNYQNVNMMARARKRYSNLLRAR